MHTVEHETSGPLAPLRRFRFAQSEDTLLATLGAWSLGLVLFTLAGFYIGTIVGHDNHPAEGLRHVDLNIDQLIGALPFALGGLVLGLIFALCVTFVYVPAKLRELDSEGIAH